MIDETMFQRLPLDVEALTGNTTKLLIGTTDARYRLPTYFCAQELDEAELRAALKATAALPGLFNRKVRVQDSTYIDGGFVDALPLLRLRVLGCQRIVAICTSPLEYEFVNDSAPRRTLLKAFSLRQHRYVRQWIGSPNPLHDENLEALLMWSREPERTGVLAIAPEAKLPDFVRDTSELHATFEAGREAAKKAYDSITWLQEYASASAAESR
jgi:predicted patatin/cPLA2 family phospholipase